VTPDTTRRFGASLAGGALIVGAVTALARIVGFGRWFVFSKTVGDQCLGDAYNTANQLPNVLFELAAGGALASVVVPLIAAAVARGEWPQAAQICSALLTWSFVVLAPLAVLAAVLAPVYVRVMFPVRPGCGEAGIQLAADMLLVFLPQVFFYAIAVVLSGALQAQHRFFAPALAPLVSSLVVISAYVAFAVIASREHTQATVSSAAVAVLAGGTTLGVVALAATVLIPALGGCRGSGLTLRPTLHFPDGVAARARALAGAGMAVLAAQQATAVLITFLANHRGPEGTLTRYTYALAIYALPYAVLAVPIATSAFPRVAAQADADVAAADRTVAVSSRAVVLAGFVGAALLVGTAFPVAQAFVLGPAGSGDPTPLALGLLGFAPGLVGYGLLFHVGRVLYAYHAGRAAAVASVLGWLAVAGAATLLTAVFRGADAVLALGLATSVGMTVAGVGLLIALVRLRGSAAVVGMGRAVGLGLAAAIAGGLAGFAVGWPFRDAELLLALCGVLLAATVTAAMTGAVLLLDRRAVRELRAALGRGGR
jgi:putative peptidoglycan lipid II flippase